MADRLVGLIAEVAAAISAVTRGLVAPTTGADRPMVVLPVSGPRW